MFEVKVTKKDEHLQIKWNLSKIEIPLSDITEVQYDDTYSGEEKSALRFGYPYGNTDRVVIHTSSETYIIYTSIGGLKEKILSFMK
ncbi:PH domain-containing protein [Bacillus spongiae]|uniref:PH domain-containing protein n=1 Tax=Bacillus spongiae TaxID=2683610 RepID=A0ABU8HEP9_9BACI